MNKARKKFILIAMISVFVLLTVLLAVINVINFTMVTEDADRITEMIAGEKGKFDEEPRPEENSGIGGDRKMMGPMGPDSPELPFTARYFTFRFDKNGEATEVAFKVNAMSKEDAESIARELTEGTTGWVRGTYRYRVYEIKGSTYVTVVDLGRELLPSYRILMFSVIGEAVGLVIFFIVLVFVSKKIFDPIEDAYRKQSKYILKAEREFRVPLTVINAEAGIIENEIGPNDHTRSIGRQVAKMTALTKKLGEFAPFENEKLTVRSFDLSGTVSSVLDKARPLYEEKNILLTGEIAPGITVNGDEEALRAVVKELSENCLKFAKTRAAFLLKSENGRVILSVSNDADLPDGDAEQVFDRYTRLRNSDGKEGGGLGLYFVKDTVKAHNGRLSAEVKDGVFKVTVTL